MNPSILPQAPYAQCCVCHQSTLAELDKVCMACGRALCQHHSQPTELTQFVSWIDYADLSLNDVAALEGRLCSVCLRQRLHPNQLWRMASLLARRYYLPVSLGQNFELLTLPVKPEVRVQINEWLKGTVTLDEQGKYEGSSAATVPGKLAVVMNFTNRDQERWTNLRKQYRLPDTANVTIHAGFLMLHPLTHLKLQPPTPAPGQPAPQLVDEQPVVLALTSQRAEHSFFNQSPAQRQSNWRWERRLRIERVDQKSIPLPVQILATTVEEGTQRSLALQVQLRPDIVRWLDYEAATLDHLIVSYPPELGRVQRAYPAAAYPRVLSNNASHQPPSLVVWKGFEPLTKTQPSAICQMRFTQSLDQPITLRGRLKLTFHGAMSQVKEVTLLNTWGLRLKHQPTLERSTHVHIHFELALNQSMIQRRYHYDPPGQYPLHGIAPDAVYIASLVKALNEQHYYVHKVVESPAQAHRTNGLLTNHFWELAGRWYQGAYPIDFHVELAGQSAEGRARQATLSYDITVQAIVSNAEMQAKVEQIHDALRDTIAAAHQARQAPVGPTGDPTTPFPYVG